MTIHLLIVDALNLIRRIHAVQGSPCQETCVNALQQLLSHTQPTHAVAVFDDDARRDSWRHQLLPDYKAGRPPMPENLQTEMSALRTAFAQAGMPCWAVAGNEADDLAATLAVKVARAGHQATIVSTDKGYCQLLAPTIRIRDYFQKRCWICLLSIRNLVYSRNSYPITGDWPVSVAAKFPGSPALVLKAPASYYSNLARCRRSTNIWTVYRKNGVTNWRNTVRWR